MIDHTEDIAKRERQSKRLLLPFALLLVVFAIGWLAFANYL